MIVNVKMVIITEKIITICEILFAIKIITLPNEIFNSWYIYDIYCSIKKS